MIEIFLRCQEGVCISELSIHGYAKTHSLEGGSERGTFHPLVFHPKNASVPPALRRGLGSEEENLSEEVHEEPGSFAKRSPLANPFNTSRGRSLLSARPLFHIAHWCNKGCAVACVASPTASRQDVIVKRSDGD